jgi:hypothetical protein
MARRERARRAADLDQADATATVGGQPREVANGRDRDAEARGGLEHGLAGNERELAAVDARRAAFNFGSRRA